VSSVISPISQVLRRHTVREHFASPLLQLATADDGRSFQLIECPGGTGQIIKAFKDDEIDIGIALTDALIAGIANGNEDYLLIGQYVTTPLNWSASKYLSVLSQCRLTCTSQGCNRRPELSVSINCRFTRDYHGYFAYRKVGMSPRIINLEAPTRT
jgi:hypothetical protein